MRTIAVCCCLVSILTSCQSSNNGSTSADSSIAYPDSVTMAKTPKIETLCFEEKIGQDLTTIKITIEGDSIKGSMEWLPWEKDQARGTLKGIKKGNEIIADYAYMIEGVNQLEEKIFVLEGDKLFVKSGELDEKNGKLTLKNPASASIDQTLMQVVCD